MRRRSLHKPLVWMFATVGTIAVALGPLAPAAQAAPCSGTKRLQLRWSKKKGTALLSLSTTRCDPPPNCSDPQARAAGTMFTHSPITVTIKDADGHSLSGVVDPGTRDCGTRCERVNRGGCLGGSDTHRLAGTFVRYVVNTQGQTTVVANKLRIPTSDPSNLVAPLTLTITDASGYVVTAELAKCRVRHAAAGAALSCS
jgi:hypothetical protein